MNPNSTTLEERLGEVDAGALVPRHFFAIWKYWVKEEHVADFVRAYQCDGDWARLFSQAEGFLKVRLLQDELEANVFLTIDQWTSHRAYALFRIHFADAYARLDQHCDRFTVREARVFEGESISAAEDASSRTLSLLHER